MTRPRLIHCSYHKCLTVYFKRVMDGVFNRCLFWSPGYRHYNSRVDEFYRDLGHHRVASVNNHALDLERLGAFRISRFVRDPRDLVVSGYHYHRRAAEAWTTKPSPTAEDFEIVNGAVPAGLIEHGGSFAAYLQSLDVEDGLLAELEFRRPHFESMARWPVDHPDILTLRYEDVLADERGAFARLFEFYGLSRLERRVGSFFARRHAAARRVTDPHVRDPSSGQWRAQFTPRLSEAFAVRHPGLVEALGYPSD